MFYRTLVANCAPTLAGIKTGSLFSCRMPYENLQECVRALNIMLLSRKIRVIVLRSRDNLSLVYMYRPDFLKDDLENTEARQILEKLGYPLQSTEFCVAYLARRLSEAESFPHEIGLFLGYPPEDVAGFIENRAQHCKCVGAWKVYGDVQSAQRRFALYKSCTECYVESFRQYHSIDKLAVALS